MEVLKRQLNVLFLGYSNELGESFRPLIKKWVVNLSYGVAVAYVLADVQDKTRKMYNVLIPSKLS